MGASRWDELFRRTQSGPLVPLYRISYDAALAFMVRELGVRRGMASIYLVGGMLDAPAYGFSDIDLVIVVGGDDPEDNALNAVEHWAFWRRFLPMVEHPVRAGVFTRAGLEEALQRSPLLQYRLGPHAPKRLLFGEDLLSGLVPSASRALQALSCLNDLWGRLRRQLSDGATARRNYLLRKLLGDAARALVWARDGHFLPTRDEAVEVAASLVAPSLLRAARRPFDTDPVDPEALWPALHALARALARPGQPATPAILDADPFHAPLWRQLAKGEERGVVPGRPDGAEGEVVVDGIRWPLGQGVLAVPGLPEAAERARLFELRDAAVRSWLIGHDPLKLDHRRLSCLCLHAAEVRLGRHTTSLAELLDAVPEIRGFTELFLDDGPGPEAHRAAVEWLLGQYARPLPVRPPATQRLSVVICTRNRAELLRRCLEGVAAQLRPADEIVVVDNGSSDHTRSVLAGFEGRLPLRVCTLPEPSIPRARNAGARAATGDILCYTDDDAVPDPTWLSTIERTFARDANIGIVGGDVLPEPGQAGAIPRFFAKYMGRSS